VITFTIPGKPIPQERRGISKYGHAYDPKKSKDAKKVIREYAAEAWKYAPPSDHSFIVTLIFYGPHWGADLDNLTKTCWDAMTGTIWKDDHQIIELTAQKIRVKKGCEKTLVSIWDATEKIKGLP
jgi:Holliday junction resolvase RusA-like endonuclease